jgi:uncharacterized protein
VSGTAIDISVAEGVSGISPRDWDALVDDSDPFLEHGFLLALERSASVGAAAGWLPHFVLARQRRELIGAVPLYLKDNSYGEFIFDWAWASAAERAGLSYYPKLVAAIPFTPSTGVRLLVRPDAARAEVMERLVLGLRAAADQTAASSIHVLYCSEEEKQLLSTHDFIPRLSMQFHWHNRAPTPYSDFEDFLNAFRSRNRKQVRHERAIAAGQNLRLATVPGPALGARDWAALETVYRANAEKHDSFCYLTPAFFKELRERLAHRVLATLAYEGDRPVAGTLNFERGSRLYGRYWGCLEERPMLHFELCYYRLIEHAIARGYTRFEAGAQGEHKLKRGLDPAFTHSAHWIRHRGLADAVGRFVEAEARAVTAQAMHYRTLSPYARSG